MAGFAIFALPTSILYIFPLALIHFGWLAAKTTENMGEAGKGIPKERWSAVLKRMIKQRWMILSAYLALALCLVFWYGGNYSEFKSGQGQYSTIGDLRSWFIFIADTCLKISPPFVWLAAVTPLFFRGWRWLTFVAAAAVLFPFVMIPLTKAGPARIYIPVFIYVSMSASIGIALVLNKVFKEKNKSLMSTLALILVALGLSSVMEKKNWTPMDWRLAVRKLRTEFGRGYSLAYPPNAGYAILANYGPEALVETFARLPKGNGNETLVLVSGGGVLRGLNPEYQPASIPVPRRFESRKKTVAGLECRMFPLKRIFSLDSGENASPLLVSIHSWNRTESKAIRKEIMDFMRSERVIMCNPWLSRTWCDLHGTEHVGYLLACPVSASKASIRFLIEKFRFNSAVSLHLFETCGRRKDVPPEGLSLQRH